MLQHRTLATRELLSASSSEVGVSGTCTNTLACIVHAGPHSAAEIRRCCLLQLAHKLSSETMLGISRFDGAAAAGGQLSQASETADLTAILSAHWHLGYRPSEKLLVAMGPFLCRHAAQLTQEQKHDLTHLLLDFEFDPGNTSDHMLLVYHF
jgi:hypothetical protein